MSADPFEAEYQRAMQLHRQGELALAANIYRQILESQPNHGRAWHLLGVFALQQGDAVTAIDHITRALSFAGANPVFLSNLGAAYRSAGRLKESEGVLRQALSLSPQFANAQSNLALTLASADRADLAIAHFQEAIRLNPTDETSVTGLAGSLAEVGMVEEAIAAYGRAYRLSSRPMLQVYQASQLPLVYRSPEDVTVWRDRLANEIGKLLSAGVTVDVTTELATPIFSLAHQGRNDRAIQQDLARLYRAPQPQLTPTLRALGQDQRMRVGFISAYFCGHTIGKLARGLIAKLSREQFHVVVISVGEKSDETAQFIRRHADEYIEAPPRHLPLARQRIVDARLDVLFYCDLGMDPMTYTLALSRLASVQCVTWGHPSTTGMETMDYFVSSQWMEIEGAQEHYSEQLAALDSLTFYYYPPQRPQVRRDRAFFGLSDADHLYVCPQSIYKFHPEFDTILSDILRRDPRGRLVLIRWAYARADDLLRERFARTMPDVLDRVVFIERLRPGDFVNLLAVSDVLLDPLHFGGGWTTLEGLSVGTPTVTLPSEYLRGRITQAMYRRMGLTDGIAADAENYAEIAVRLGTDEPFRQHLRQQILERNAALFADPQAVRELEDFLRQAVERGATRGERDF